jgi:hypothetical protein
VSRGLGAVQRDVLRLLDIPYMERWTTIRELAGEGATRARVESFRRAVLKLRDAGLVEVATVSRQINGYTCWLLAARLALHDDGWGVDTFGDPIRRRQRDVQDEQLELLRRRMDQTNRKC